MDSYRGRSGIRRGWRGGADSGLTAVINHLPRQPDAGWQEGARRLEWRLARSLPEMSFCQLVSGGTLSVINPSDHLSINYFSGVKPVCGMLHFTAVFQRRSAATLTFSEPTGRRKTAFATTTIIKGDMWWKYHSLKAHILVLACFLTLKMWELTKKSVICRLPWMIPQLPDSCVIGFQFLQHLEAGSVICFLVCI